jgi:hemerythrin-like domain-containing protein
MKKENTVSEIMLKHHHRLEDLFDIFIKNIGKNFKLTIDTFERLEEELKGHFSVEEKVIFKLFDSSDKKIFPMIQRVTEEHNKLLEMFSTIKNDLVMENKVDPSAFKNLLLKHKDFEDEALYPEMDRALDQSQKTLLIKNIDEII